jgi:hypothetical protein
LATLVQFPPFARYRYDLITTTYYFQVKKSATDQTTQRYSAMALLANAAIRQQAAMLPVLPRQR